MGASPDIAAVAEAIGHPARAAVLDALAGGDSLSASELARRCGLRPSAASPHLARLLAAGLVRCEGSGRHRYFRLAGAEVSDALEALAVIAPRTPSRSLRDVSTSQAIARARSCYDHAAGMLGVAVADSLAGHGWVAGLEPGAECRLTRKGAVRLADLGVDVAAARERRRSFARGCLDWTERRPHLAGSLGAAVLDRMLELRWVRRRPSDRALTVTTAGVGGLRDELAIQVTDTSIVHLA